MSKARSSTPRAGTPADDAVPRLFEIYGPRIHALARRLCPRGEEAEDIVQEVFLQAFRKWHTFRGEADPGTWLYRIAVRACRARFRRGRARRPTPLTDLMPWRETTVMELAAASDGDEDPAQRREAIERVQSAITGLPEHLRVPLVLKEVVGLEVSATAAVLGLAENTVKTRLHRARLALRRDMTGRARAVGAPAPIYDRQVCLDLLKAKMESMDRGGTRHGFGVPKGELCARCRAVFRELDLVQDACAQLSSDRLSASLRRQVLGMIRAREAEARGHIAGKPQRGRKPVKRSAVRPGITGP